MKNLRISIYSEANWKNVKYVLKSKQPSVKEIRFSDKNLDVYIARFKKCSPYLGEILENAKKEKYNSFSFLKAF